MTGLGSEPPIRQSDKRAIQTLLWALKPLLNLRGSIPLPYVTISRCEGRVAVNSEPRRKHTARRRHVGQKNLSTDLPHLASRNICVQGIRSMFKA